MIDTIKQQGFTMKILKPHHDIDTTEGLGHCRTHV